MFKQVNRWAVFLGLAMASLPVCAQSVNSVRVYTQPPGLQFTIDGQYFFGSTDYLWPANSKHVIAGYDQRSVDFNTRFTYMDWVSNLAPGVLNTLQPITADPNLQWIRLDFKPEYLLTVKIFDCSGYPDGACPSAGQVSLASVGNPPDPPAVACGTVNSRDCSTWLPAGSTVQAQAFPSSGYIFTGWGPLVGQPQPMSLTPFQITFTMTAGEQLSPMFFPARPIQVNLQTQPPNLQILADRTPYYAPVNLEWGYDTTHTLGTLPSQSYLGKPYAFDSWSDGGAINHDYKMPAGPSAVTVTANFLPAATVAFLTSPPGLSLGIDGRLNWQTYNFIWAAGSAHAISAPAMQTDAQGHKYRFDSWSNGKPEAFSYTVADPPVDDRVTARYQALGQITVASIPAGVALQVDGASCTTPCVIERPAGTSVKISAPGSIDLAAGSRLVFQGWGDSADALRVIPVSQDASSYALSYRQQNRLSVSATPPEGASLTVVPSSPDGFYDAGSVVSILPNLALGFRFAGWSGDYSGTTTLAAITLDSPKSAVLLLDRVPAIAPVGVRSAAPGANAASVAPSSLISIFGVNLAPASQIAATNPLAQTLQTVTVRVDDATFLPLVFVSPEQINAQISSATPEGTHKITVHWEGKPETTAQVVVTRNAPGLFSTGPADQPIGSFVRVNGEVVTPDNPATAGEIVTGFGTGLGPYASAPPDGFLVAESSAYALVDSVTVVAGDATNIDALYAGRSAAGVGVDAVRFQLPNSLPDSSFLPVKVRINGQDSNSVLLPISH